MYRFRAMNTSIETYYLNERHSRQTEAWFRHAEKTLSRFLRESELSQLNRTKNTLFFLPSDLLYEAIFAADHFYHETEGLFNPYLGRELCSIGYDRSFEKIHFGRTEQNKQMGRWQNGDTRPPEINSRMRAIIMHGASIDLGGIGKGWIAQQAANQLQGKKAECGGIAAGGDIIVWGKPKENWNITISAPESWGKKLFSFKLDRSAGIATSSTIKRSWKDETGKTHHHILDPRTSQSSDSDLIQASVMAPDLPTAEVYAKCMIILGWEKGMEWLTGKCTDLGIVGVKDDHSIVTGGAIRDYSSEGVIDFARPANEHS
ncbi:FAD:protein FMN transferase [Terrilactibacillus sp. S3-3]|nr:FAD:protein FMN transferase [Terrilactibacillus sp. S3-3]